MGATGNLVRGSLLGLVALAPACKDKCDDVPPGPDRRETGEGQPPRLIGGEFLRGDVVQLAFSEPLAAVDAVDPEKFRLGVVALEIDKDGSNGDEFDYSPGPRRPERKKCESFVHYCDPTVDFDDCVQTYSYYYGGYGEPEPMSPTRVVALELDDDDASLLELRIDPPIREDLCLKLDYADAPAGIHAFFSSADIPTIEDRDGEELAAIAPHWVASGDETTRRDSFEALAHWQPLPCPKHF